MHRNRILRERVAGQSAMSAIVSAQSDAPQRGALARILGVSPLTDDSKALYRSALGELLVGDVLENIGPSWDVLHDLPLHDSSLDHLLIGRAGVFTVRTVNYGREDVTVDGSSISVRGAANTDLALAEADAQQVADLLESAAGHPVRVRPLLVVVGPRRLTVKPSASAVRVLRAYDLERVLDEASPALSGDEVARISDLADLESTWPTADESDFDTQQLHRDFNLIRAQVTGALARRIFWASAATVIVYAAVCSVIATFVSVVVRAAL